MDEWTRGNRVDMTSDFGRSRGRIGSGRTGVRGVEVVSAVSQRLLGKVT